MWRMKRPSVDSLEPTNIMDTQESKGAESELQGPSFHVWHHLTYLVLDIWYALGLLVQTITWHIFDKISQRTQYNKTWLFILWHCSVESNHHVYRHVSVEFAEYNAAYILFVFEAEEFAAMVSDNTLHTHIGATQAQYPGFIICYLVNKLKWYLNKK